MIQSAKVCFILATGAALLLATSNSSRAQSGTPPATLSPSDQQKLDKFMERMEQYRLRGVPEAPPRQSGTPPVTFSPSDQKQRSVDAVLESQKQRSVDAAVESVFKGNQQLPPPASAGAHPDSSPAIPQTAQPSGTGSWSGAAAYMRVESELAKKRREWEAKEKEKKIAAEQREKHIEKQRDNDRRQQEHNKKLDDDDRIRNKQHYGW